MQHELIHNFLANITAILSSHTIHTLFFEGNRKILLSETFNEFRINFLIQQNPFSLYKRQQDYIHAWKEAQAHNSYVPGSGPNYAGPNYAYATGAYTPNGIHQTAGVYPPNKVICIDFVL